MRGIGVLVRVAAVLVRRRGVFLGFVVAAVLVVVRGLAMVMRRGLVMRRRVVVVFTGRMRGFPRHDASSVAVAVGRFTLARLGASRVACSWRRRGIDPYRHREPRVEASMPVGRGQLRPRTGWPAAGPAAQLVRKSG